MKVFWGAILFCFVVACGSPTPFRRGPKSEPVPKDSATDKKPTDTTSPTPPEVKLDSKFFDSYLEPAIDLDCKSCHENHVNTFAKASELVVAGQPKESSLFKLVQGQNSHPLVWKSDSIQLALLQQWIEGATKVDKETYFNENIKPMLTGRCGDCHSNPAPDFDHASDLVTPQHPWLSLLYLRATGHNHRKIWPEGSEQAKALIVWINML